MTSDAGSPGGPPGGLRLDLAAFVAPPGGTAEPAVRIVDAGDVVQQYTLAVDGLDPDWWTLDPETLSLFPGESGAAILRLRVPPGAAPGTYPFRVTATPRAAGGAAGGAAGADASLEVAGAVERLELSVAPSRRYARRRATYTVRVANRGTGAAGYRVLPTDPAAALRFTARPEDVSLEPGAEATVRLDVEARRTSLAGPAQ